MKYLFLLLFLIPMISFADDSLTCGSYGIRGKYEGKDKNGIAVFTGYDGHKVLFSFENCIVVLG